MWSAKTFYGLFVDSYETRVTKPRNNEPLYNQILSIMNNNLHPSNG